jgi:hypothetical protein
VTATASLQALGERFILFSRVKVSKKAKKTCPVKGQASLPEFVDDVGVLDRYQNPFAQTAIQHSCQKKLSCFS